MSIDDVVREFLIEGREHLARLERDLTRLRTVRTDAGALDSAFRALHSIKGACGFLPFERLEAAAHAGESLLVRLREGRARPHDRVVTKLMEVADDIRRGLSSIEAAGDDRASPATARPFLPMATMWRRLATMGVTLAARCGKQVRVSQTGGALKIDRDILLAVRDPLIQLVRNAVTHGIEPPAVRRSRGKPQGGVVRLTAARDPTHYRLSVSDDGVGLDRGGIRRAAVRQGLASAARAAAMADAELVRLLFEPGFSTADTVGRLSGRGAGLDIVRVGTARIGGRVTVRTREGRGTTFTIAIPRSA